MIGNGAGTILGSCPIPATSGAATRRTATRPKENFNYLYACPSDTFTYQQTKTSGGDTLQPSYGINRELATYNSFGGRVRLVQIRSPHNKAMVIDTQHKDEEPSPLGTGKNADHSYYAAAGANTKVAGRRQGAAGIQSARTNLRRGPRARPRDLP